MRLLRTKLSRWKVGTAYFLLYCLFFMVSIGTAGSTDPSVLCPSMCTCTRLSGLVNCTDKGLRDLPETLPTWTRTLLLRDNRLSSNGISKYNFTKLQDLEELDLSGNKLTSSLTMDLTGLDNLRAISLNHCSLSTLPHIKTTGNLTHLSLSHNSLTDLHLENFTTLFSLDLSFNKLRQIKDGAFRRLNQLTTLYLQKNRLSTLAWSTFIGLDSIELLDLSRNKIKVIRSPQVTNKQERCSGNLQTLKHLNLSQNLLTHIDGLTFSGMCSLESLHIDRNKIAKLKDGAFYGPAALTTLILDHNYISSITRGWLFQLESLQTLSVAYNNLTTIEGNGWNFCKELLHLDLSHNRLISLSSHGFSELHKLQTLQLGSNKIAFLEDFAFDGLGMLKILNLSNNLISSSIEDIDGSFLGLNSIEYLSLRDNRIRSLSSAALEGVENVLTLDLCQNDVTSIQNHTFDKMTNLKKLSIVSSSFLCDCQLAWFPDWLRSMDSSHSDFSYTVEGSCFHPPKLEGRDILGIQDEEFVCVDHPIPVLLEEPQERTALIGDNVTFECGASATYTNMGNATDMEPVETTEKIPSVEKPQPGIPLGNLGNPRMQNPDIILGGAVDTPLSDEPASNVGDSRAKSGESRPSRSGGFPLKADEPVQEERKRTPPKRRDTGRPTTDKNGMAVTWKRGQEIIHSGTGIEIQSMTRQQGGYVYVTSHLVLKGVTAEDNGKYNCIVSNNYGHTRSKPVELVVNEYPRFTKTPANVTVVMNGSSAVIDCAATGQPSPLIQWQKDGGKDFPAAKQRRLRREQSNKPLMENDDDSMEDDDEVDEKTGGGMMLIPGDSGNKGKEGNKDGKFTVDSDAPLDFALVLPEDAGEYECVVESSVGKIVSKAMLIVEMPPSFPIALPEETRSLIGENVAVECLVEGKPDPQISWFYNVQSLNLTTRHHFAENRQILVLSDVQKSDAGAYMCTVENKHGRIEHTTQLKIVGGYIESDVVAFFATGYNPLWLAAILVIVCVFVFLFTWLCCHFRYKKQQKEMAPSTNTDETDLYAVPPLDGNSFTDTDDSIKKGQSSHSIHRITDETIQPATQLNGRYDPTSPYRGSVSMSDISHMQIIQTPGGKSNAPLLSPNGFVPRQLPKRSHSHMAIRKDSVPITRFQSAENFKIHDDPIMPRVSVKGKSKPPAPLIDPSAAFAKKAATGADNYIPVVLKAQKSTDSTAPPNGHSGSVKNGSSSAPPSDRIDPSKPILPKSKSKKGKGRNHGQPHRKEQHNRNSKQSKSIAMGNGKIPSNLQIVGVAGTHPFLEQNNTQGVRQSDKRDNFAKSRSHKDRRKPPTDSYHLDSISPPEGSVESSDSSQRLLRLSDQPKSSEFSSGTTLASESSSLLSQHNAPTHNYHMPPSGCVSDRLLS